MQSDRRLGSGDVFGSDVLPSRFWEKVRVDGGCWRWTAYRDRDGYGRYALKREDGSYGVAEHTHRTAYRALVGCIPTGYQIDHLCRVRDCLNPAHLEAVTLRENVNRSENYIAKNRAKTHCVRGHELSGANLVMKRSSRRGPQRVCRTCRNAEALARYHRKRGS